MKTSLNNNFSNYIRRFVSIVIFPAFFLMLSGGCVYEKDMPNLAEFEVTIGITNAVTEDVSAEQETATFEVPDVPTQSDETLPLFSFIEIVSSEELLFEIYEYEPIKEYGHDYTIKISAVNRTEDSSPDQTLEVFSPFNWTGRGRSSIDLVDIDFDGYPDIEVLVGMGVVNACCKYYRWDALLTYGHGFEPEPFFELVGYDYKLFPDTKQIIGYTRDGYANYPRTMYQLGGTDGFGRGGQYTAIRYDYQSLNDGESPNSVENETMTEKVFFFGKEIFSNTIPLDEYDPEKSIVSEDFLRFGVDNPISVNEAYHILMTDYGEFTEIGNYQLSYIFEEMCLIDEISCYKFKVEYIMEDHRSSPWHLAVTHSGEIIYVEHDGTIIDMSQWD